MELKKKVALVMEETEEILTNGQFLKDNILKRSSTDKEVGLTEWFL